MPGTNELIFQLFNFVNRYLFTPSVIKPKLPPGETIRFGLISAALINPPAIIYPSKYFPEVEIIAIAARDKNHAIQYAKRWGIKEEKAYEGYQALLDDKDVDAVFIGLPNGLHAEWAIKALQAGKHVLLEKPSASNAIEAREIQSTLQSLTTTPKPVFLEAFHYRFHPATVFVRGLLSSGTYGKIQNTYAFVGLPASTLDPKNIRFNFDLGGGALMDLTYSLSVTRYMILGPGAGKPREIVSANAKKLPADDRIDIKMEAEMIFDVDDGNGGTSEVRSKILSNFDIPNLFGLIPRIWEQPVFVAECEKATITYNNFIGPYLSHSIVIKNKVDGKSRTENVYSFDPTNKAPLLSTYGHQLDTFVKKVKGRDSELAADWIPIEDTVAQMEVIDEIYQKAGMPIRNGSVYAEILKRGGQ